MSWCQSQSQSQSPPNFCHKHFHDNRLTEPQKRFLSDVIRPDRILLPQEDRPGPRKGRVFIPAHRRPRPPDGGQQAVQDPGAAVRAHRPGKVDLQDHGHEARDEPRQGRQGRMAVAEERRAENRSDYPGRAGWESVVPVGTLCRGMEYGDDIVKSMQYCTMGEVCD